MDLISQAIRRHISRRRFLKGGGSLLALPFLSGISGTMLAGCSSSSSASNRTDTDKYNTQLVVLGSSGGVGYWPGSNRASSSSALVVNDTIYLVDLGQGSMARLNEAFNTQSVLNADDSYMDNPSSTFLNKIKALFFTHIHPDHIADYANLLLIGAGSQLGSPALGWGEKPLKVIGPCDRGQPDFNKNPFIQEDALADWIFQTDSADPDRITSTPGTIQMTDLIFQGVAQAVNDLMLDDGYPNYRSLIDVSEIGNPLEAQGSPTCPLTAPFQIYPAGGGQDENGVSVTATLVDHHQVYPAFAFRFDTPDGSVVFSGDTGANTTADRYLVERDPDLANGNLQMLADGADILVHEVIDTAWVNQMFGDPDPASPYYVLKEHMLNAHTPIERVGQVAAYCNVKTLVLNHIVPGMAPISHLEQAQQNFPGNLIISQDLMRIGVSTQGGVVL
ncbi:MAG: MBL fold metallo-hydrolase [Thermodesulfobacteriota bacterium]